MQEAYQLRRHDAVLQKTPFSFDVSVWEFFWPLMEGGKLVIARPEGHKEPGYLVDVIRKQQIKIVHFVPSMLQVFLEHSEVGECASLVDVICSGEALPGAVAKRFSEKMKEASLNNLYGPTEAAVDVTAWRWRGEAEVKTVPIGRPIANTQVYLLDSHGEPAPVGVVGEIHIGGVQVARGYLRNPELTAEKFVADPFSGEKEWRMYKTGDLGRYMEDGEIEYLGRNDFQVKVRGNRIELGEIEAVLNTHESVKQSVVAAREEGREGKRLVGYVVAGEGVREEELRRYVRERLP